MDSRRVRFTAAPAGVFPVCCRPRGPVAVWRMIRFAWPTRGPGWTGRRSTYERRDMGGLQTHRCLAIWSFIASKQSKNASRRCWPGRRRFPEDPQPGGTRRGMSVAGRNIEALVDRAAPLSEYAWKFRYPGESDEPSAHDADEALAVASRGPCLGRGSARARGSRSTRGGQETHAEDS